MEFSPNQYTSESLSRWTENTVHRIHFEDRGGTEFERLVFAYLIQTQRWQSLEWLGESGDDGGRDIWGMLSGESYCYQCANHRDVSTKKVTDDIDKLKSADRLPRHFYLICGGKISNDKRQKIKNYCAAAGIQHTVIYSGVEFEEILRRDHPAIIKRFVMGVAFPEIALPDFLHINTDTALLVGDIFNTWLFHETPPSIKTLYRVFQKVSPYQLKPTEIVFLMYILNDLNYDFDDDGDIPEFSFEHFIPFITSQATGPMPVLTIEEQERYDVRYFAGRTTTQSSWTSELPVNIFHYHHLRSVNAGEMLEIFMEKDEHRKIDIRVGIYNPRENAQY